MKKIGKIAAAIGCSLVMAAGFASCAFGADIQGKSAYQIAQENGYSGTEEQWLKSLQGANGENGTNADIQSVYSAAVENGYAGTFLDFLGEYLSLSVNENNDTSIIAHNMLSSVSVVSAFKTTTRTGGGLFQPSSTKTSYSVAAGSGVIWSLDKEAGDAYVVTNYHVVYDSESDNKIADVVYLYLYGGFGFSTETDSSGNVSSVTDKGNGMAATYVGGSLNYDIAVLRVENSDVLRKSQAETVELGNSDTLAAGEKVFAVGNAEGEGISVTSGVVSVDSESLTMTGADEKTVVTFRVLRTDAAINPGNSGGGLFDLSGKLIGITNAKSIDTINTDGTVHSVDNMGYALPISQVKNVVENLMDNGGTVKRAMFGITVQVTGSKAVYDAELKKTRVVEDVSVADVTNGSLADGSIKAGDVITSITVIKSGATSGETLQLTRQYQMIDQMLSVRQGDTVSLTVTRNGEKKTFSFVFDKAAYFTEMA